MRALLGKPAIALPLVADSELLASTSPAASQHCAAIFGGHAGEKTVRFGAVSIIRLKSTFWHLDCPARWVSLLARAIFELEYATLKISVYQSGKGAMGRDTAEVGATVIGAALSD